MLKERMFLIDTENISDYSFFEEMSIGIGDTVVMFITENSKAMKVDTLPYILKSSSNIIFEKVSTGTKNELDFQLVAYLGMCSTDMTKDYYVVSNDKGFEVPIKFLMIKNEDVDIELLTNSSKAKKDSCIKVDGEVCIVSEVNSEVAVSRELEEKKYTTIDFGKLDHQQRVKECRKIKIRQLMEQGVKNTEHLAKAIGVTSTGVKRYQSAISSEGEIKLVNVGVIPKAAKKLKVNLERYM